MPVLLSIITNFTSNLALFLISTTPTYCLHQHHHPSYCLTMSISFKNNYVSFESCVIHKRSTCVYSLSLGSAPSCSSTPPPAFDDISEHGVYNNQTKNLSNDYSRSSSDKRLNSPRSTSYREDSVRYATNKKR